MANNRQREGLRQILAISRLGNQLIQMWQPWVKVKKEETKPDADACVMLAGLVDLCLFKSVKNSNWKMRQTYNHHE